jgi:hypothetical protein
MPNTLLLVHPLLGNVLVNKFLRREILGKQSIARLDNNGRRCIFYVVRAEQRCDNGVMEPISKQRLDKHISACWTVFTELLSELVDQICYNTINLACASVYVQFLPH